MLIYSIDKFVKAHTKVWQFRQYLKNGWFWKYSEDYVVREWTNVHGDKCKQMGNVICTPGKNTAGGISIKEDFVSTSDQ